MSQFESDFEERFYREREQKLDRIAELGARAGLTRAEAIYPNHFRFTTDIPSIRAPFDATPAEALEAARPPVAIAGRLVAIRLQGKAGFAQLQQGGQRLQLYVRKDNPSTAAPAARPTPAGVSDDTFELYKLLDLGDHIGVQGTLFRTRTGELTVQVEKLTFLAKAMLPLPDKFSGLGDIELRYRRRYLDLFTDTGDTAEPATEEPTPSEVVILSEAKDLLSSDAPQTTTQTRLPARTVFTKRAAILRAIRNFFDTRGYLEVETPMLHTVAGGAAARPFTTHHNALDMDLALRIAPELYLKRLVVGGLDRVYEINRNFRNEGVSTQHNPEFTMLEFYQAYANYHDLMDLTIELIAQVAQEVNGTTTTHFNGVEIDLSKWTKLSMREAIIKFWKPEYGAPPTISDFQSRHALGLIVKRVRDGLGRPLPAPVFPSDPLSKYPSLVVDRGVFTLLSQRLVLEMEPLGKSVATLFEFLAEPHLIQPHIIYDFPLAVSPLSKIKPDEPDWVERFEFYIGGFEVGNAFSELNDPADQLRRFQAQLEDRKRGDEEAMAAVDEDYVRALGYGLPPTAGEGIGIDRLTMILTGSRSIRDVILFPLMRPKSDD